MSTIEQEVSSRKRRFGEEFKRDAVRLVAEEKYSFQAAATAVGVSEQSLRAWHAKLVPPLPPCGENASFEELKAENVRLRKQLKRAELEREILKKATAYFAKASAVSSAERSRCELRLDHEASRLAPHRPDVRRTGCVEEAL